MATNDVLTVDDESSKTEDLAKNTFMLLQQLSSRVQSLEVVASLNKNSAKRSWERLSDSGDESEKEKEQRHSSSLF